MDLDWCFLSSNFYVFFFFTNWYSLISRRTYQIRALIINIAHLFNFSNETVNLQCGLIALGNLILYFIFITDFFEGVNVV